MPDSVACVSSCTRVVQRASSRLANPDGSGGVALEMAATASGGETSPARGRVREREHKYYAVLHELQQRQFQLEAAQRMPAKPRSSSRASKARSPRHAPLSASLRAELLSSRYLTTRCSFSSIRCARDVASLATRALVIFQFLKF